LKYWADQGVLLLNAVLTVRAHAANSHKGKGWETFTNRIIEILNNHEKPLAFILWGNPARVKKTMITDPRHFIVESAHPSPLSADRGFFGSRPFSKVNDFLKSVGEKPIDWQIPDV
jgi:uracil-DNA glycosylase